MTRQAQHRQLLTLIIGISSSEEDGEAILTPIEDRGRARKGPLSESMEDSDDSVIPDMSEDELERGRRIRLWKTLGLYARSDAIL